MRIEIIRDKISRAEPRKLAAETFGDMVKAVVDVERGIMAVGGEMHADAQKGNQAPPLRQLEQYCLPFATLARPG